MKTPAEWLAEQVSERPDDFAPDEMAAPLSLVASVQADARADPVSDAEVQAALHVLDQRGWTPPSPATFGADLRAALEAARVVRMAPPA